MAEWSAALFGSRPASNDGDAIILAAIGMAIVLALVLDVASHHYEERQAEKLIQQAQDLEIAEGITLGQGVDAFFGVDILWASEFGSVYLLSGLLLNRPRADVRVCLETGEIEVCCFRREPYPEGKDESELLIDEMVRAVRTRRAERGM